MKMNRNKRLGLLFALLVAPLAAAVLFAQGYPPEAVLGYINPGSGWIPWTAVLAGGTAPGYPLRTVELYCKNGATVGPCNPPGGVGTRSLSCQPGLGDGLNAIPAGTYLQTTCRNETGGTWTLTAIRCVADAGASTCNVTNGAGTALLTAAVTGTSAYANGTQSATTTIASGDFLKITLVADGTSKQLGIDVAGTY